MTTTIDALVDVIQRLAEHDQRCDVFDLDDEGRHKTCSCGLEAALTQARAEQSNQLSGNSGTLNLIATTPPAAPVAKLEPWMVHARKLVQWRHCMSYNDSYFGESAGLLKHITTELERLMPEERLEAGGNG